MNDPDGGVGGMSGPPGKRGSLPRVNRRKHPRIQARLNIRTDGAMPGSLTTRNISLGGAFGETSQPFPIGAQLSCELVPQRGVGGFAGIRMRARVLRSETETERGRKINLAAVQFLDLGRDDQKALQDLLQDLSGVIFSEPPTP